MDKTADTVGELIKVLSEYPKDMKITYDYGLPLTVVEREDDKGNVIELTIA